MDLVGKHGSAVVFLVVFLDQLGVPLPSPVLLLGFGALAGSGHLHPVSGLFSAILGSLCADYMWFLLGRWKGGSILSQLCRVTLEPDECVNRTQSLFSRYGMKSLLVAKFVPGLDTVAPPLAGILGASTIQFFLWSAGGAFLWLVAYGGLGYVFSESIVDLAQASDSLGNVLLPLLAGLFGLWLGSKYLSRRRLLRKLRMERIKPDELLELMRSGRSPVILDARNETALQIHPFLIEGARPLNLEQVDDEIVREIREHEVIVYCA